MKKLILIPLLFLSSFLIGQEGCLLDQKQVQDLVQDYADVLTDGEENSLRSALQAYTDTTSNQVLVVTVNDLCGYDKASFTYTLGEKWGVGQDGKDNGVVIMVKPHGSQGDRHAFIAPGYGLEGVLPDAIAKRIVENEMIPYFKNEQFADGIFNAANTVMEITAGEYSAEDYAKSDNWKKIIPFLFGIVVFILIIMLKARQTKKYAHDNGLGFWAAWSIMNAASRSHGGSWNNFSSGGGGFGGFGGGSFGGGGAGGSW